MPTYKTPLKYTAGINNVGSYMVSGRPWVKTYSGISSGTDTKISFPKVTKSITVINQAAVEIHIYFCDPDRNSGAPKTNKHYIALDSAEDAFTMNIRVKDFVIESQGNGSGFTVFAELTNIDADLMYSYDVETATEGISD